MLNSHNYTDFDTNLKALYICKKFRFTDTLEEFEIYRTFKIIMTVEIYSISN